MPKEQPAKLYHQLPPTQANPNEDMMRAANAMVRSL